MTALLEATDDWAFNIDRGYVTEIESEWLGKLPAMLISRAHTDYLSYLEIEKTCFGEFWCRF